MEQQRLAGVYSGYIGSFLEHGHFQRKVSGWAATVPNKEKLTADYLFDVASFFAIFSNKKSNPRISEQVTKAPTVTPNTP